MGKITDYFAPQELVGRAVFQRYGASSFRFFDPLLLECLVIVREGLGLPMVCNTWHNGGIYDERGLRDTTQSILQGKAKAGILYLSSHVLGRGIDFTVIGMSSVEVRNWIAQNADLFPCKIRLERNMNGKPISWVHLDTMQVDGAPKVSFFDV